MKKIKVLIADDHAVVRSGLAAILDTEADIKVVGLAKNGAEAVETALAAKPDVIIMDIRMPVMDGAEATAELREKLPDAKVLVLTSFGEADGVALALKSGSGRRNHKNGRGC
jgi:DNA-binding NarL/FixJ family response regulator